MVGKAACDRDRNEHDFFCHPKMTEEGSKVDSPA
jgi:hypothetical protein